MKKYHFNSEKYIFGLESMRDKCSYMLECEWDNLTAEEVDYWENLRDECESLLWKNSYGGLTGDEVARVKEITLQRETMRYNACIANGMNFMEAEKCFK